MDLKVHFSLTFVPLTASTSLEVKISIPLTCSSPEAQPRETENTSTCTALNYPVMEQGYYNLKSFKADLLVYLSFYYFFFEKVQF